MKVKSWSKLFFSILLAQSAGLIGTIFTFDAIPTWYATLTRPVFAPPNWVFGPAWTILYTLIGISLYLIWTNKKGSLKLFLFHLFLNAIWSPIFFGAKNLGLALVVITVMDVTLIMIIKSFYKINKVAALILIPYLMWISFATVLNFSFWQLNPTNVSAQEFNFAKARQDFVFSEDNYRQALSDYNLKKSSYNKNPTLSLKEEFRDAAAKLISSRNEIIRNYLTMIRMNIVEAKGLDNSTKEIIYSKLNPEVEWYKNRDTRYESTDTLEDMLAKSKEEDSKYKTETEPVIHFTLANISLGEAKMIRINHIELYKKIKSESDNLVKLGRADANLFERWYTDIDAEIIAIESIENATNIEIQKILDTNNYQRSSAYRKSLENLTPIKNNLSRLNSYLSELENVIISKR